MKSRTDFPALEASLVWLKLWTMGFKLMNPVKFAHVSWATLGFPVGRRRFGQRAAGKEQGPGGGWGWGGGGGYSV